MDQVAAKHVCKVAFECMKRINETIEFVRHNGDEETFLVVRDGLLETIATIGREMINPMTNRFPDLEREISESIEKYGMLI